MNITAIAATAHGNCFDGSTFSVGFDDDDGRYHLWLNAETFEFKKAIGREGPVLYKNPPVGADSRGKTQYLRVDSKFARSVLDLIRPRFPELLAQAKAEYEAAEAKRLADAKAEHDAARVRAAGPELLAALRELEAYTRDLLSCFRAAGGKEVDKPDRIARAQRAIAKAEGRDVTVGDDL